MNASLDEMQKDYELQRQIAKDLLKEKMQREMKVIKLNKRLQERLQLPNNRDLSPMISNMVQEYTQIKNLETLQAIENLDQGLRGIAQQQREDHREILGGMSEMIAQLDGAIS